MGMGPLDGSDLGSQERMVGIKVLVYTMAFQTERSQCHALVMSEESSSPSIPGRYRHGLLNQAIIVEMLKKVPSFLMKLPIRIRLLYKRKVMSNPNLREILSSYCLS